MMDPSFSRLQWRMQNCLHTILEVHEYMGGKTISPEIVRQLETLKGLIRQFLPAALTEQDLERIESSTNLLLGELSKIFKLKGLGQIHPGYVQ
jgi:hypothetical protein